MEHLYRLINKDKVVGYMKLEGGKVYHRLVGNKDFKDVLNVRCEFNQGCEGYHRFYIEHTRIDQYTGIEIDGVKVFERDEAKTAGRSKEYTGTVKYSDDFQWMLSLDENQGFHAAPVWFLAQNEESEFEITGIKGVK